MTEQTQQQTTTLVVGATGKTGRRVVQRLADRGLPVRGVSRSSVPAFDWDDETTWPAALEGCTAAYVSFFPDLGVPGSAQRIGRLADLALAAGVRHVVLLSGRGEEEAQRSEEALAASGVEWTVVRCSWFSQNFSESFFLEPVQAGELALPVNGVLEPFVDLEDVADVAVAALTQDGHAGRVYELTGPRLLTFADAVGEIGRATGRDIRFAEVGTDEWMAAMAELGEPEDVLGLLGYLFTEVLDGRNASLADGVQQALGRPARDFADFVRREAAAGTWEPAR